MPPSSLRRVPVNTGSEEKLLTGLIVDDEYCRRVLAMIRPDLIENQFSRRIIEWVRDYQERYDKAPGLEIQDIFAVNKAHLGEDEATIIEIYLGNLSRNYEAESNHNWPYQIDLSRDYLRARPVNGRRYGRGAGWLYGQLGFLDFHLVNSDRGLADRSNRKDQHVHRRWLHSVRLGHLFVASRLGCACLGGGVRGGFRGLARSYHGPAGKDAVPNRS